MTAKPKIVKIAIKSLDLLVWLSGISSSTTTYIIAPAANASKNGKIVLTFKTSNAPITLAIGSTIPVKLPIKNAFLELIPSLLRGKDTAVPSGKFWSTIPNASIIADINDALF